MRKYFLLLYISFFVGQLSSYSQDLKVGEKTYHISGKKQINNDIEYLQLKEKSVKKAKAESFIRVNDVVSKTVFSEAEIKKFLSDGKVSSLGKVVEKEIPIKGKILHVKYMKKGAAQILFLIEKNKLQVREYYTDIEDRYKGISSSSKAAATRTDQGWLSCRTTCDLAWIECTADDDACAWLWDLCMESCNALPVPDGPAAGRPRPPVTYYIPIKNAVIKIK